MKAGPVCSAVGEGGGVPWRYPAVHLVRSAVSVS